MDSDREELLQLTYKAVEVGKNLFEQNGHNSMSWVVMALGLKEDEKALIICPEGVPPGHLFETLQEICSQIPFQIHGVTMIMDTFTLDSNDMDPEVAKAEREKLRAGDLSRRFAEGDVLVRESLSVCMMTRKYTTFISVPYIYTDIDGWEWAEPKEVPEDASMDWDFEALVAGNKAKAWR